jgi:hypothetical protein
MAAALHRICTLPQPDVPKAMSAVLHDLRASAVDVDVRRLALEGVAAPTEAAAIARGNRVDEIAAELALRTEQLNELHRTKAYRAAILMRAIWKHQLVRVVTAPFRWAHHGLRLIGRR